MAYFYWVRRCTFLFGLFFLPGALMAGVYTVTNSDSSGPGSLAQAVNDANSVPGPHQIVFAIPGPGVHTIDLSNGGVVLGSSITIDGYTQPGASANTLSVGDNAAILIQLDGGGFFVSQSSGVTINGDNCVVRGLSFTGFYSTTAAGAISIGAPGHHGNRIEGNFIGLSPDGVSLDGNGLGVFAPSTKSTQNVIGGNAPAARNIISGNGTGVFVQRDWTIAGNYFGTDASGLRQGYGNDNAILTSSNNIIGTGEPGGGNVVTGNQTGIQAIGPNTIRGNLIGPYADGSPSFGNGYGIVIPMVFGGSESLIGGMGPGEGNVIAFNDVGVAIGAGSPWNGGAATILSNLFYGNLLKDVDLNSGGLGGNDFQDQDTGPNGLQNFPIIMSVVRNPGETVVSGGLNSKPSRDFILQFFASAPASNPSQTLLGTQSVTTNSAGDASFRFTFPATSSEDFITATATDPEGNTSEFFPPNGKVDLANISTRGNVSAGSGALIGGFILDGNSQARAFLIRALGPSLDINGALSDPQLQLIASSGVIVGSNDDWRDFQAQEISATGLAPTNDNEAALIVHPGALNESNYTVLVTGVNGGSGVATVEVYALAGAAPIGFAQRFLNLSTRGSVGTGDNVLIGGTILQGNAGQKLIVRAIGPDLAGAGVADPLQNPTLELRDAEGTLLASNDDWRSDQEQEIIATGLAPQDDRDSAILTSLLPTAYTAIVRGKDDSTGIALVEIYKLD